MRPQVATGLLIFSVLGLAAKYTWVLKKTTVSKISVAVVGSTIFLFLFPYTNEYCESADKVETGTIMTVGILFVSEIVRTVTSKPADFLVATVACGHVVAQNATRLDNTCNSVLLSVACAVAAVCLANLRHSTPNPSGVKGADREAGGGVVF